MLILGTRMTASADKTVFTETIPSTPASPPALRSFYLQGPAGRLEALLNEGRADAPFATLICHPHPLGGGTMHNKVVYHAAKVFSGLGWPVLRFNFRGTGLSQGAHDGRAEVDDVRTALDWLAREFGKPIVAAGFSFGAAMGLKVSSTYHGIQGFAALGLPTHAEGRDYHYPYLASCIFPKLFLSGDRDQYAPAAQLTAVVDSASEPRQFVLIPGADHFFVGHLPAMQAALGHWLNATFLLGTDSARIPDQAPESRIL
jgi:alpha/beta superfamily hydrolase